MGTVGAADLRRRFEKGALVAAFVAVDMCPDVSGLPDSLGQFLAKEPLKEAVVQSVMNRESLVFDVGRKDDFDEGKICPVGRKEEETVIIQREKDPRGCGFPVETDNIHPQRVIGSIGKREVDGPVRVFV